MRYSIRWMLGAMAYVALIAAAISTASEFLADIVWAVSLVALGYGIVVASVAHGKRRAMAIGFVALSITNVVGLYLKPYRLPAVRLLYVLGYSMQSDGDIYVRTGQPPMGSPLGLSTPMTRRKVAGGMAVSRTVHGVETMVAGLVGCLIGALAYRHSSEE
jgi:hypothetical protein